MRGKFPPHNPLQKIKRKKIRNLKKQRLLRKKSLSGVNPLITPKRQRAKKQKRQKHKDYRRIYSIPHCLRHKIKAQ